jgi:prolyl-tRNA editing enzyme YbaK/EbsC (Cys-tRNA(Pro) deacylase)
VERVERALREGGVESGVVELSASTRTAADAAAAIGCTVSEIAKSLVFRTVSGAPILVIASGTNRVDEHRVAAVVGEPIERAPAEFVRERSGYAIGGVPPLAHAHPPKHILIDADLMQYDAIWAAAGSPNAVVRLTPAELLRVSGGEVAEVRQSQNAPSPGA